MFYGQYTHVDEILEKVRDEFGFEDVPKDSAMEHIWIALGRLGVKNFLQDFDAEIEIESGRGLMPSNIMILQGIRDKDSKIALTPSKDIFIRPNHRDTAKGETRVASYTITGEDPVVEPGSAYNEPGELEVNYAFVEHIPAQGLSKGQSVGYQIRGDYIYCELGTATLEVKYKGFPIWDDYTPKIPDTSKVVNFLVQYIAEKVAKKYWMQDKLSRDKYETINQDRLFAQGEARNGLLTPDDNEMELIQRMMVRLLPQRGHFNTGFKYLGEGEQLR